MKTILCVTLAMASVATAQSIPSFLGTWKGTAATAICGKVTGSTQVTVRLSDEGYRGTGQISGPMTLSGAEAGFLALDEAIVRLEGVDAQAAAVVRLKFYGGLDDEGSVGNQERRDLPGGGEPNCCVHTGKQDAGGIGDLHLG